MQPGNPVAGSLHVDGVLGKGRGRHGGSRGRAGPTACADRRTCRRRGLFRQPSGPLSRRGGGRGPTRLARRCRSRAGCRRSAGPRTSPADAAGRPRLRRDHGLGDAQGPGPAGVDHAARPSCIEVPEAAPTRLGQQHIRHRPGPPIRRPEAHRRAEGVRWTVTTPTGRTGTRAQHAVRGRCGPGRPSNGGTTRTSAKLDTRDNPMI